MKRSIGLSILGSVALVSACGSSLPRPEFEAFDPRATPGLDDHPDSPAVVVLDRGTFHFTVDVERRTPMGRLRRHRRLKILRPDGASLGTIEVPYDPGTAIHGLIARAIGPDGATRELDMDAAREVDHPSGRRAKRIVLPGVAPGTIVEYAYDQYFSDVRFIAPWEFQGALPTERSEFAVVVPRGFQVDLRYSRDGEFVDRSPERFDIDEGTRFSWSEAKVPPLFPEPNMPDAALLAPRAHVLFLSATIGGTEHRGFRSWQDVADWFTARCPNWAQLSAPNADEARRIAGDSAPDEIALKLLEIVARDLPSEPGPPPPLWRASLTHPDAVLSSKRANPSSRGLLLTALLRAAGINAVPALVSYRDRDVILPDTPNVFALDGVVAFVPRAEGPLVLDPSSLTASTDVAAPRIQGTRFVVLHPGQAEVGRVPLAQPSHSRTEATYALTLTASLDVVGTVQARFTGTEASTLRKSLLEAGPERYASTVNEFLTSRGASLPLASVNIADLGALRRPLTLTGAIDVPRVAKGESTELYLPLNQLLAAAPWASRQHRRSRMLLPAPHESEVRITLSLPEDFEAGDPLAALTFQWSGGQTNLEVRKESRRRFGFLRSGVHKAIDLPISVHPELLRYESETKAALERLVVIRRPPPRALEY